MLDSMTRRPRGATCMAMLALALTAAACNRDKPDYGTAEEFMAEIQTARPQAGDPERPMTLGSTQIKIEARLTDNGVEVIVENVGAAAIVIGPKNFRAAPSGSTAMIPFREADPRFPVTRLEPGRLAVGTLSIDGLARLEGGFIFFNHPDSTPARARIEKEKPGRSPRPDSSRNPW